jgi:hypothetical protein
MIPLPSWVDAEAWAAFMLQKELALKKKRKVLTLDMAKFNLRRLYEIKEAGHDPNKALWHSMNKGYDAVWPDENSEISRAAESTAGRELAAMKEHEEALRVNPVDAERVRSIVSVVKTNLTRRA